MVQERLSDRRMHPQVIRSHKSDGQGMLLLFAIDITNINYFV